MNRRNNIVIGLIFILFGAFFLLKNMNIFTFSFDIAYIVANFWPSLFLILPGLLMHSSYFSGRNRDAGILVPGGILLTTGIICQLSTTLGIWHILWPGFILAVAVGLFELYLFGTREKGLLIPVGILGGLALIFFTSFSFRQLFGFSIKQFIVPAVLILLGVSIILKNSIQGKHYGD